MKKKIFILSACVITYLLLEVCSFIGYSLIQGEWFSFEKSQIQRKMAMRNTPGLSETAMEYLGPAFYEVNQVIHPYLGFVADPTVKKEFAPGWVVNQFGFYGAPPLFESEIKGGNPDFVIGVFGGSVAFGLALLGMEPLVKELNEHGLIEGRPVRIVPLAMGGFKQPQQLMALNYFLILNAHFDLILNLDGFNDIVLPYVENLRGGIFPIFPRSWATRVWGYTDNNFSRVLGRVEYLRDWRKWLAEFFSRIPFRVSIFGNVLWALSDEWLKGVDAAVQKQFRDSSFRQSDLRYVATGPKKIYQNQEEMYRNFAEIWGLASSSMHALAKSRGIPYFHFLQPNQYVPNSKTLSKQERHHAYDETSVTRTSVLLGYPYLQKAGRALIKKEIPFFDLTMIFEGSQETLYVDKCCHLNPLGNQLLGKEIGRLIVEETMKVQQ